ncbi:MAG: adenylate kinase [Actinomycetota bacterium]|nr:adenylate kinase [Actinomycetota bacterium]
MRMVMVGPPGAGKGTQATHIAKHFAIPQISTGDIFRENVSNNSELGQEAKKHMNAGDLVPDEVTIAMVRDRLAQDDARDGFLLDGFPRTEPQAEALSDILAELNTALDAVLELAADDEEVVRRLSGRRTCRTCGKVWHVEFDQPAVEGVCDDDGGQLFRRDDDAPETVQRRLEVYAEQTEPLVGYYESLGILRRIEATGKVDEVTHRAITALEDGSA